MSYAHFVELKSPLEYFLFIIIFIIFIIFNINSKSGPKILKALKSPLADVQILHLNKETKITVWQ